MRLLIADDHTLFRDALVEYISRAEPDAEILLAKDLYEVLDRLKDQPDQDLVLLDKKMPGMCCLEGLQAVIDKYPDIPVVLMSGVAESADVEKAMEIGAMGFFPKTLSGNSMLKAIQLILAGEKFLPIDPHTNKLQSSYVGDEEEGEWGSVFPDSEKNGSSNTEQEVQDSYALTPREKEVLGYLLVGVSNKEIANKLALQEVTVKLHVRGICQKLDVQNRTQAALKAMQLGFAPVKQDN